MEEIPSPIVPSQGTLGLTKPTAFKVNLKKKKSKPKPTNDQRAELSEDLFELRPSRTSDTFPHSSESEFDEGEHSPISKSDELDDNEAHGRHDEDKDLLPPSTKPTRSSPSSKRLAQTRISIFPSEKDREKEGETIKIANKGKKRRRDNEWPEPGFDGFDDPNVALYQTVSKRSRSLVMRNGMLTSVPNE